MINIGHTERSFVIRMTEKTLTLLSLPHWQGEYE